MQIGDNITVSDCLAEYNLGHGYHPGTGITSGSWTNNVGRFNGWDGLFFCHRVRHTTVSGNRFHDNGWNGIGGLGVGGDGGDRYNVVSGNFCYNNARSGIECTLGGNNVVVNNVCENNSQSEPGKWPGILVEDTHSSVISGNRCLDFQQPDSTRTQYYGILVTGSSRDNTITGNILSGHAKAGISGDALDRNIVADNITIEKHKPEGI
jgi:parallel beta-helix repeat protein